MDAKERERLMRCVLAGGRGSSVSGSKDNLEKRLERLRSCRPDKSAEYLAKLAKALSDPIRIAILKALGSEGSLCVCELVIVSGRSQPSTSHHLRILDNAGLLKSEKRGRWVDYSLSDERILDLLERLRELADTIW